MKIQGNVFSAGLFAALLLGNVSAASAVTYQAETNNSAVGVQFESTNDTGGGQNATAIDAGDYIQWTVNVAQAGTYKLTTRSATANPASIEVFIDGAYTAELGLAKTTSLATWQSFTSSAFALTAGSHTLRVRFATGGQKLNWVDLSTASANVAEALGVGLWRLSARNDRRILSQNSSTNFFIGNTYTALPNQHWRLVNRGGNNYDFKLESTLTCLARVSGAASLAACNTAASQWTLDLLRARSVDRPAIYRLRSAQNTCLIPPASVNAQPTIGTCDANSRWYLEPSGFGERSAAQQYAVHGLLIVKPSTNFTNTAHNVSAQGSIEQSIVDASQVSFQTGAKTWLERITDGRVTWVGTSVVATDPIRDLHYDAYSNTIWQNPVNNQIRVFNFALQRYDDVDESTFNTAGYDWINFLPSADKIPNDVQRFVPRGLYDNAQVFFTGGTAPGGWGWGPGRSAQSNHTLWTTVNGGTTPAYKWLSTDSEPTEVFLHEAMHGYDAHYDQLGLPLPEGYLHGTDSNGYGSYLGGAGWVHWYRDYWLGTVIASDDTYRGYGPRMFSLPTIRQFALAQPESTLKIVQATSGKCLSTQGNVITPGVDTPVVLSATCNTDASSFVLQADGMLRHKASGYCVHPQGGTAYNASALVFWPSCVAHPTLPLSITDGGSIKNTQSGRCVHPQGGSATPAEGTATLFYDGCDEERLRFHFNRY